METNLWFNARGKKKNKRKDSKKQKSEIKRISPRGKKKTKNWKQKSVSPFLVIEASSSGSLAILASALSASFPGADPHSLCTASENVICQKLAMVPAVLLRFFFHYFKVFFTVKIEQKWRNEKANGLILRQKDGWERRDCRIRQEKDLGGHDAGEGVYKTKFWVGEGKKNEEVFRSAGNMLRRSFSETVENKTKMNFRNNHRQRRLRKLRLFGDFR